MEIIDLILSGDLDINFYLLSIELIIAVAFMFLKLRLWLKVALLLLTCLNLYLTFMYVNHFLCIEKVSDMYEAIAFLGLIYLCSGFMLSIGFRMILRVYKRLKLKKHVRDSE